LVVKDKWTPAEDLRRARPERQIAFKFEPERAVSTLVAVEWNQSGATYTPIGVVEPVRLAGTTVQRANLNNPGSIRELGLFIGASVEIVKRGEIIPKIEKLAELPVSLPQSIPIPDTCESCGTALIDEGTRLFCPNPLCPARLLHRLGKWADIIEIRELGDKLLAQLFEKGTRSISDLYYIEENTLAEFERMGTLSAAKVVRNIRTKRVLPLAAFVAGFDIDNVGELIMEKLVNAGFDTLEKLRNAAVEELSCVHGIGDITAKTIAEGLAAVRGDMDAVLEAGYVTLAPPLNAASDSLPLSGKSYCFTGELKSLKRAEAEKRVRAMGGTAKSAVTKDLSYLVANDPESGTGKNKKARDYGVAIIGEEEFLRIVQL
jgi:DNA ligase (NAD+)